LDSQIRVQGNPNETANSKLVSVAKSEGVRMARKSRLRQFEELVQIEQKRLGLLDWNIGCDYGSLLGCLADVETDVPNKLATITLNRKWCKEEDLRELAMHEVFHVLLAELTDAAEKYLSSDYLDGLEHGIIIRLISAYRVHE
jgi:hypothetical protein